MGRTQFYPTSVEYDFYVTPLSRSCTTTAITTVCDPAATHSQGGQATLAASSTDNTFGSGLHLECTDGPAGGFGLFLVSDGVNGGIPLGNGTLCLDQPVARYDTRAANTLDPSFDSLGVFDATGTFVTLRTDQPGFGVPIELPLYPDAPWIQPGSTYVFQCWFRDGPSSNLSNALSATFY